MLTAARQRADLTMAVPLTASRLDRLEALCRHWSGPVSAAVYAATIPGPGAEASLDVTRRSVQALFDRCCRSTDGCQDLRLSRCAFAASAMAAPEPRPSTPMRPLGAAQAIQRCSVCIRCARQAGRLTLCSLEMRSSHLQLGVS